MTTGRSGYTGVPGEASMHDTTATAALQQQGGINYRRIANYAELHSRYPTTDYLRRRARHHIPHFAFEYSDGGSGRDDAGIRRNWAALDAVELVPRYGVMPTLPPSDVKLFGRRYSAPIGVCPNGWALDHLAGRRQAFGAGRAARRRPLHAQHRGRRHHRRDRRDRAGCVLVPALSLGRQRSRYRP